MLDFIFCTTCFAAQKPKFQPVVWDSDPAPSQPRLRTPGASTGTAIRSQRLSRGQQLQQQQLSAEQRAVVRGPRGSLQRVQDQSAFSPRVRGALPYRGGRKPF